jgi:heme/copper-type cytochrome/quinol oxidase subunit 2
MRAPVHVVSPAAFKTWLGQQKPSAPPPVGATPPAALNSGEPGYATGTSGSSGGSG